MDPVLKAEALLGAPDAELQSYLRISDYVRHGRMPWRRIEGKRQLRIVNGGRRDVAQATPLHEYEIIANDDFDACMLARFHSDLAQDAAYSLAASTPEDSARSVMTRGQIVILAAACLAVAAAAAISPTNLWIALNAAACGYFILALIFRLYLVAISPIDDPAAHGSDNPAAAAPVISILVPLYREADAAPAIVQAIASLDYPEAMKDVIFLVEADDEETRREIEQWARPRDYRVITAPDAGPKTKPKACNVGLRMSRGDIVVIYDAEDRPEPDQLRKAARAFAAAPDDIVCFQAKLNYYNRDECWLAVMFTLEYSLWFDWLLPALQKIEAPIPLGGTSNFFRTKTLVDLGGWDPFNVTEDADLGLRIARRGLKTAILDSTTFEEANCRLDNWLRQRSRWLKGYMQTWLVHMRRPGRIIRRCGWSGFFAVQMFVLGNVVSALINPLLLAALLAGFAVSSISEPPALLEFANLAALTLGNGVFIGLMMLGPARRPWRSLGLWGVTAPAYWLLSSVAAYKALWQLLRRPHFWEKTDHVISAAAISLRAAALEKLGRKAT